MLDALRRGILLSMGRSVANVTNKKIDLVAQKKRICQNIGQLTTHEQKIQVLLAVAQIAGFEAIGAHNRGCLVDITNWDYARIKRLSDVILFVSK